MDNKYLKAFERIKNLVGKPEDFDRIKFLAIIEDLVETNQNNDIEVLKRENQVMRSIIYNLKAFIEDKPYQAPDCIDEFTTNELLINASPRTYIEETEIPYYQYELIRKIQIEEDKKLHLMFMERKVVE